MPDDYGVNTQKLALAAVLSVILVVDLIVGLTAVYYRYQGELEDSARFTEPPAKAEALRAKQEALLTDYRLIDPEKGVVGIPIDRAMELVVAELAQPQTGGAPAGGDSGRGERR